jgi:hypothetical protein
VEKIKYTVLIPLYYNDGSRIPDAEIDLIYNEFYVLGDGYTLAGNVTGAYRMKDGSKRVDESAVVWVGITPGQEPELKQLASSICARLKQECIYLERSGGTIEFVPPPEAGGEI